MREPNAFHELVIDVITGPVMRPRVGHLKRVLERDRRPGQIRAPGCRPGPGKRIGQGAFREEDRVGRRMIGIGRAGFPHEIILSIHHVMPRAAVPMIVAGEVENARTFDIESDVEIVGDLVKEMAGVRPFVAAAPIVGAAHISPHPDPLLRPALPHAVGIQPHRRDRQLLAQATDAHREANRTGSGKAHGAMKAGICRPSTRHSTSAPVIASERSRPEPPARVPLTFLSPPRGMARRSQRSWRTAFSNLTMSRNLANHSKRT